MKFFLQTQIGIEKITELELESKFRSKYSFDYSGYIPHKNGMVQIEWKDTRSLNFYNELGTIEDAFLILDYVKNISATASLKEIFKRVNIDNVKKNLDYFFDKLNTFGPASEFRFVTRKKASNDFRRIDLENIAKDFFRKNTRRMEVTDQEGVKEVWVTLVKNRLILAVRLTTKEMRHSYYKTALVDGSLRPSVAFGMNFLADIKSTSTIWDPFCGAGTIGAEIVDNFKFKKLLLSDISAEAIENTKENLGNVKNYDKNKGKVSIRHEDFFESKNYADIVISNLPFGNKYGIEEEFISNFWKKVNATKQLSRLVILFPVVLENKNWQKVREFPVQVLGYPAYITVYHKLK